MRIGIDATCLPSSLAGAGRYIHGIVQGLGRVDRENEYFVFIKENDAEQFRNLPENIQLVCLPRVSRPLRLLWQHALAGMQAQKLGLDVWHGTHYALPNFTNGTARVATFHDLGVFHHPQLYPLEKRIYFRRVMRKAAGCARHIIAVSLATTHNLLELLATQRSNGHAASQNVTTILSGVEEKFFARLPAEELAAARLKHGLTAPYILFVGTFEKRKNLVMLLRAFHEFCQYGHHDHVLALAGQPGNGSAEVMATIAELHLQERVRVLGYVSEVNLPALYQGADLFALPSLYEGFGFPLLEAMAGGVVALASNNSSLRELAMHPQMLCEETPSSWAARMESLLFDKTLRYELVRFGADRARQYSWQSTAEKLREVYESACPGKRTHTRHGKAHSRTPASISLLRMPYAKVTAFFKFMGSHSKLLHFAPAFVRNGASSPRDTFDMRAQDSDAVAFTPTALSLAAAVKKTLAYADLFDYPLTAQEIRNGLIEHAATHFEVVHELERLCARGEIMKHEGFYCLPGRAVCIGVRERRSRASAELLWRHRRVLSLIKNFPFVRAVALSGALAFQNAEADDDLDLFLIVESGRLWLVYSCLVLLMKVLGMRRRVCLNCLFDTAHLVIADRDFFVAHQIVFLRPLAGVANMRAFWQANEWCAQYLPQKEAVAATSAHVQAADATRENQRWRKRLALVLRCRMFDAAENFIFKIYRRRIRHLTSHLNAAAVVSEAGQIKLFTNNHRFRIQQRLEQRLQQLHEPQTQRTEEEQRQYATL